MKGIIKQLGQRCTCSGKLSHQNCGLVSWLYTFKGGVYYTNGSYHRHSWPTHLLHLQAGERVRFEQLVATRPNVGPLGLLVGRRNDDGSGTSAADISPVLLNVDRIKAEKRKVKSKYWGNQDFVEEFGLFERNHPGFIVFSQFGAITIIILQTRFMVTQLIKEQIIEEAVNGIVSDAAHGYWQDKTNLLIISSSYSTTLQCWVPGMMTYSNGASEDHYQLHFRALFETMAEEAVRQGLPIKDDLFKNVIHKSYYLRVTIAEILLLGCRL